MSDLDRLQGTWNIAALEMDGRKVPVMGAKIVVQGDRFTSTGMGATYEGRIVADTGKSPKTIDMIFDSGPEKGNTSFGIFEFEDNDTWKLCLTTQGENRPGKFATEAGTGHAFEILKREGAAGSAAPAAEGTLTIPAEPADAPHLAPLQGEWKMVSGSLDGQALEKSMIKYGKRVTEANETTVSFGGQVYMKGRFRVDTTKNPHTIDFLHTQGSAQGQTQLGVYEIDGQTFQLALAAPGKERAADFSSKPGDGKTVATWKLAKRK
jgi:uncharacterized protein (TIGR03067 family)